ncbi:MAG: glycine zipper 2TM domain-containing protein, partial [Burkholderiales bacterium]|nr:glycine zipper 2TM domain-containing protein [Burkholderiales bacterium]
TPVVQQVSVPRQVCTTQPMITEAPRSGAGAVMGALAGGAMGNAIGDGGGRALATMIGLVGGAMLGNNIEGAVQQVLFSWFKPLFSLLEQPRSGRPKWQLPV